MTLGEKILNMRKARGWNQEELAERVGVTRQAVSRWEADSAKPDADKVIALCDIFGVSADYLLRECYNGEVCGAAGSVTAKSTAIGEALRALSLKQWIGGILFLSGCIVLIILQILSGIYPCYWNDLSGLWAFLKSYGIELLWYIAAAATVVGAWSILLEPVRKWGQLGYNKLSTFFDRD